MRRAAACAAGRGPCGAARVPPGSVLLFPVRVATPFNSFSPRAGPSPAQLGCGAGGLIPAEGFPSATPGPA